MHHFHILRNNLKRFHDFFDYVCKDINQIKIVKIKVLVVGAGNMGVSHALAYHELDDFEICGIVSTGKSKETLNNKLGGGYTLYSDFYEALADSKPDAVCISTYPDTHEAYAIAAMEAGCHVFLEKPIADSVDRCRKSG